MNYELLKGMSDAILGVGTGLSITPFLLDWGLSPYWFSGPLILAGVLGSNYAYKRIDDE